MAKDLFQIAPAAAPSAPATTLLYDDWYPALRSERLRGKRLTTTMLLGIPLVLGRELPEEAGAPERRCGINSRGTNCSARAGGSAGRC